MASSHKMVKARGSKTAGPGKLPHRKALSMHISRAANGFTTRTDHAPHGKSGASKHSMGDYGQGMGTPYEPPEENVFNNHADLMAHVNDKFGDGGAGGGAAPDNDGDDEAAEA